MNWFAHAEELHTTSTSTLEHYLTEPWLILGLITLAVLAWWRWTKRWQMAGTLAILFIGGLLTYRWSPWVSVFCISAGFCLALLLTMTTISPRNTSDEETPAE